MVFINEKNYVSSGKIFISDENDYRHLIKVERIRKNQKISVFDPENSIKYSCIVSGIDNRTLVLLIVNSEKIHPPKPEIFILQGLIQKGAFDEELHKLSEIGVNYLVPIVSKHSQNFEFKENSFDRFKRICEESAKSVGNPFPTRVLPTISITKSTRKLEEFLEEYNKKSFKILLSINDFDIVKSENVLSKIEEIKNSEKVFVAIGSEGGFSEDEEKEFVKLGFIPLNLGKDIMYKSDTVAIGISFIINTIRKLS